MNIGIVGLGLIGGSVAKAIKHDTSHTVLGFDIDRNVVNKAKLLDVIDVELTDERIGLCDMIIVALYPADIVRWVTDNEPRFKRECIVTDCGGVKGYICERLFPLAAEKGFTFIGAHPMAGLERSGFDNAQGRIFRNASIVMTAPRGTDLELLHFLKKFWGALGFTNFEYTTPEEHDRRIAFTSQLAHVVSSAYIKSPSALLQHGFSAGSYKDMTRVARLNERMWSELFLENGAFLSDEIGALIEGLQEYRDAIDAGDAARLTELLRLGRERKEQADREDTVE